MQVNSVVFAQWFGCKQNVWVGQEMGDRVGGSWSNDHFQACKLRVICSMPINFSTRIACNRAHCKLVNMCAREVREDARFELHICDRTPSRGWQATSPTALISTYGVSQQHSHGHVAFEGNGLSDPPPASL